MKMGRTNVMTKLQDTLDSIDIKTVARKRLLALFDENSFCEIDAFAKSEDKNAGVIAGYGTIQGSTVYAFSQDISADAGAVNVAHAKKIIKIYDLAIKTGSPVIAIFDSNGAKIDEGNAMLSSYSEILMKSNKLSGVVVQIAVVLGTCGGTNALLASSADVLIMSKTAQMFMTAPFITSANGDNTANAGCADNAAASGLASIVCENETEAINQAAKIISMLPLNNLSVAPFYDFCENEGAINNIDFSDVNVYDLINAVADKDSVTELSKTYGAGIVTAFATLGGSTVGIVATQNKEFINKYACEKTARFVKICDSFNIPLITFVDTDGFEITGDVSILKAAAKLSSAYAEATTVKVSVITGKAFGPAFITLASKNSNADITFAWPQALVGALAPATAVEFLWNDRFVGTEDANATRKALQDEYIDTLASPFELAKDGFIESVINPIDTRYALISTIDMLAGKRESGLPKKHTNI
ncbi:MAG: carboxyl transferase domain-containing protein [Oscillospiraceae bacterium]